MSFWLVVFLIGAVAAAPNFSVSVTEQEETSAPEKPKFDSSRPPTSISSTSCGHREENCYEKQSDFAAYCKLAHDGATHGGRCFFTTTEKTNWDGGFALCNSKGGEFAQFHTKDEFDIVVSLLRRVRPAGEAQWASLRRIGGVTGVNSLPHAYTFWYSSPTKRHRRLSVANTWVRTHDYDDSFADGQYCMVTYGAYNTIGDTNCDYQFVSTCVTHNVAQSFLYIKGICIDEVPIETHFQLSLKECAKKCAANSVWCRSFNYWTDETCELSSMVLSDTLMKSTNEHECFHYSFAP